MTLAFHKVNYHTSKSSLYAEDYYTTDVSSVVASSKISQVASIQDCFWIKSVAMEISKAKFFSLIQLPCEPCLALLGHAAVGQTSCSTLDFPHLLCLLNSVLHPELS
jgi:hypothetical protein